MMTVKTKFRFTLLIAFMSVICLLGSVLFQKPYVSANYEPLILTNLSEDKKVSYFDYNGNLLTPIRIVGSDTIPDNVLTVKMTEDEIAWVAFNNSIYVCNSNNTPVLGWAVIDLGEKVYIDKLNVQFWNDHSYQDIIVQTSADENFTDNLITVFNSDVDGSVGQGKGTPYSYTDQRETLQTIELIDSYNRYIRITANDTHSGDSKFSRLEVIGAKKSQTFSSSADVIPVLSSHESGSYETAISVTLKSVYENAFIYYTTDGSVPTNNSTLYTGAINVDSSTYIRAIVYVDGIPSEIKDFEYLLQSLDSGKNVALGKPVSFYNLDFTAQTTFAGFNGSANNSALINDNSLNPTQSCIYTTDGLGWAVIDFGKEFSIDKVCVSFWHDWSFTNVQIELSQTADFKEKTTVFEGSLNNNSSGLIEYVLQQPVQARYLRATNHAQGYKGFSVFTELQAFSVAQEFSVNVEPYILSSDLSSKEISSVVGVTESEIIAELPTTITYNDSSNQTVTVSGSWNSNFEENTVGNFVFTFNPDSSIPSDVYGALSVKLSVVPAGDKSQLLANIDSVKALNQSLYTLDSLTYLYQNLVKAELVANSSRLTQEEIDNANETLLLALNQLEKLGNSTVITTIYEEYEYLRSFENYSESKYTQSSFDEIKVILDIVYTEIIENGNINNNEVECNNLLDKLQKAVKGLQERGDTTALQEEYQSLLQLNSDEYTLSSWENLQVALKDAKTILDLADKSNLLKTKVDAIIKSLKDNYPVKRANAQELTARYEELYSTLGVEVQNTQGKLKKTWFTYINAMYRANAIIDNLEDVSQATADDTLETLNQAVAGLVNYGDKTQLRNLVNQCLYQEENYSKESFAEYTDILNKAQKLLDTEDAEVSAEELEQMQSNLENAIKGLVGLANKTSLNSAVRQSELIDYKNYTASTANNLLLAISQAKLLLEKENATQEEIDLALSDLSQAILDLVDRGDTTQLKNTVEEYSSLSETQQNTENYNYFKEMLDYANEILKSNDVSQNDVDNTLQSLKSAYENRNKTPSGCKSSVNGLSILFIFAIVSLLIKKRCGGIR